MTNAESALVLKIQGDASGARDALNSLVTSLQKLTSSTDESGQSAQRSSGFFTHFFSSIAGGVAIGTLAADAIEKIGAKLVDTVKEGATALPDLIQRVAEAGDHLWVMSQQTGVSAEALSKLDYVASQTGTSLETITGTIFMMSRRLGENTTELSAAIERLGLDVSILKKEKPEDAFNQIVSAIGRMPDATAKAQAGWAIFGRQFRNIAQLTTQDMQGLMDKAEAMGLVTTKAQSEMANAFTDAEDDMRRAFSGIEQQIGYALMPMVTEFIETTAMALVKFTKELNINTDEWGRLLKESMDVVLSAIRMVLDIGVPIVKSAINAIQGALEIVVPIFKALVVAIEGVAGAIKSTWGFFPEWAQEVTKDALEAAAALWVLHAAFGSIGKGEGGKAGGGGTLGGLFGGLGGLLGIGGLTGAAKGAIGSLKELIAYWREFGLEAVQVTPVIGRMVEILSGPAGLVVGAAAAAVGIQTLTYKAITGAGGLKGLQQAIEDVLTPAKAMKDVLTYGPELPISMKYTKDLAAFIKSTQDIANADIAITTSRDRLAKQMAQYSDDVIAKYTAMARAASGAGGAAKAAWDDIAKEMDAGVRAEIERRGAAQKAGEDALIALTQQAQKLRIEATQQGMAARVALAQLEGKATLDKMARDYEESGRIDTEYAQKREAQIAINAQTIKNIRIEGERSAFETLDKLRESEVLAQIQIDNKGLAAQKATIDAKAEFAIADMAKTLDLAHQTGENLLSAQRQFEARRLAIIGQANLEKQALDRAASDASIKEMRALAEQQIETTIKLQKVGFDQELDLLHAQTKFKLEEKRIELSDDKAFADAALAIQTDAANKERQMRGDNAKKIHDQLAASEADLARLRTASLVGIDKAIEQENIEYREKIRLMKEAGVTDQKLFDQEQQNHLRRIANIQEEQYETKSQLATKLQQARELLSQMERNGDASAATLKRQKQLVKDLEDELNGRMLPTLGSLAQAWSQLGQVAGGAMGRIATGIGSLINMANTAITSIQSFGQGLVSSLSSVVSLFALGFQFAHMLQSILGKPFWADFQEGMQKLTDLMKEFGKTSQEAFGKLSNLYQAAGLGAAQLAADLKALIDGIKSGSKDIDKLIQAIRDHAAQGQEVIDAIHSAGYKSHTELMKAASLSLKVFNEMLASGDYTAAQLTKAYREYQQALADAGDEAAKAWLKIHGAEGQAGDEAAAAGYKTIDELKDIADKALKLAEYMRDSGKYTADEIADAFDKARKAAEDVADPMKKSVEAAGYQTKQQLQEIADKAKAVWEYMRDSGQYNADQIKDAFEKAQDAQAAALGKASGEYKKLLDSVKDEAPEEVMGVIEKRARDQMAAIDAQAQANDNVTKAGDQAAQAADDAAKAYDDATGRIKVDMTNWHDAVLNAGQTTQKSSGETAAATQKAYDDAAKATQKSFDDAVTGILGDFGKVGPMADTVRGAIDKALGGLSYTVAVHFNVDKLNLPRGLGASTEPFPSFEGRPIERVTGAGFALLHPGDVVGVPQPSWKIPQQEPANQPRIIVLEVNHKELARATVDGLIDGGTTMSRFRTIVKQAAI